MLPYRGYWVFFGSSLVALDDVPLPLGVAVEPLGCVVLLAPPEADPEADFSLSFSASVVAELELDALGELDAPDDGLVALGELAGGGDDALLPLEPDAPGAVEVRSRFSSPQAASPRAIATATANVESLMCPPGWVQRAGQQISDRV
ncbi:MAG: hypothetical protein A3G81_26975 [Betaproteobacteria bacterium RIFCSPLOWO2_12_FULL_65_14]|nr:MAG: hypothetical protein A3G81_26975 [Betaproteobacteria bacterium RIFCSPLOWO2_12_FULL_65_14]